MTAAGASAADQKSYAHAAAKIQRRVERSHLPQGAIIPLIGGLLVLIADTQALALLPLQTSMQAAYGLSASQAGWTLSATSIATAASTMIVTRLGDRYGVRRLFLFSLSTVVIGQLLCAVAGSFPLLVAGRAVLGLSAAIALLMTLIRETSQDKHQLDRISGVITSATGAGIALAFLFGGWILSLHGTIGDFFWIVTGLSALLWLLAWMFIPDNVVRTSSRVDWLGGGLLGCALTAVVLGVGEGNSWGWTSPSVVTALVVGVLGFVLWTVWELRCPAPMIDLRLVRQRTVWPALLAYGAINALGLYTSLAVSNYVQTPSIAGYGMSGTPLKAGVYLLPIAVPIAFGGMLAAPVIKALGTRASLVIGTALIVVDELWFAYHHSTTADIVLGTAVFAVAYALANTASIGAYMSGGRRGASGMMSGAGAGASTMGLAFGPAVFTSVLTSKWTVIPGTHTAVPAAGNYRQILIYAAVGAAIALLGSLVLKNPRFSSELDESAVVFGAGSEIPAPGPASDPAPSASVAAAEL